MRKIIKTLLISSLISVLTTGVAFASDAIPSLDEVVTNAESSESSETTATTGVNVQENKESIISALEKASDLSETNEQAVKVGTVMERVAAFIIQVLAYGLTIGLVLRVVIDLIYIGVPFLRSTLANGYMGNPNAAGGPQQQQGMGGLGGMGIGGYGAGGYGGGYGSRYGGMGMGGMGGLSMQNQMGMQTAMNNQPRQGRIQFVSTAALNAVATENMVGPDGEANSAFKTYVKDMVVILVVTPVLITLAVTGVLHQLGFMLGDVIANGIRSIRGGF